MTTATHTIHTARLAASNILERVQMFRGALRSVSLVALRRWLIACSFLFALLYVFAAHFTLYAGGRFSDLQAGIHQRTNKQVRQESLLTNALSARAIRAGRDMEDLVDVSAISYIEGQQDVALNVKLETPAN